MHFLYIFTSKSLVDKDSDSFGSLDKSIEPANPCAPGATYNKNNPRHSLELDQGSLGVIQLPIVDIKPRRTRGRWQGLKLLITNQPDALYLVDY